MSLSPAQPMPCFRFAPALAPSQEGALEGQVPGFMPTSSQSTCRARRALESTCDDFEDAGLYLGTGSTERDESRGATVETAKEREMCHSDTHALNNAQTYRFLP